MASFPHKKSFVISVYFNLKHIFFLFFENIFFFRAGEIVRQEKSSLVKVSGTSNVNQLWNELQWIGSISGRCCGAQTPNVCTFLHRRSLWFDCCVWGPSMRWKVMEVGWHRVLRWIVGTPKYTLCNQTKWTIAELKLVTWN